MHTIDETGLTDAEFRAHHGRSAGERIEPVIDELADHAIGATIRMQRLARNLVD